VIALAVNLIPCLCVGGNAEELDWRTLMKNLELAARTSTVGRREFLKMGAGGGALAMTALGDPAAFAETDASHSGSIDIHSHWMPEIYAKALNQLRPGIAASTNPLEYDLEKRRQWMDQHGVRMVTLTLSGGMPWQWASPADGAHLAQIINDAAVEAHAKFPDRFIAGIEIPVRDPQMCLKELNRMAGKPGMRAVHLPNSFEGRDYLFEPAYEPVLARCEELGYPLLFHPLDGEDNIYAGKDRLGNPLALSANINNTLGFTFESATTAAKFIITGTLDKFPNLDIVLPHSGGCFPYIAGRVERGLVSKKFKLPRPFREYIRRFHYDTLTFYPETMRFLISLVGADRVVIGTDNYAAMDVGEPNELVERLNLSAEDRGRIFSGNAARLFRL
jgi:aminocarboxymuconate-semialdehyde decarboxylase